MFRKLFLASAFCGLISAAYGQSQGTLNLLGPSSNPPGPQITTVQQINGPVNTALAAKQDTITATGLLKGNGPGVSAATAGVDYLAPSGSGAALTGLTFGQIGSTPTTLSGYGITNALATTNNLSDLSNATTARTNLGLGSLATQSAGAVNITGGSIGNAAVSATSVNGWVPIFGALQNNSGTPVTPGSGNARGDALTLNAGCTGAGQSNPIATVTAVTSGGVTNFAITWPGQCSTIPINPIQVLSSSGGGTGATFNLTFAPQASTTPVTNTVNNNQGNFIFASSTVATGLPPNYSGSESMFIAPFMGNILSGDFNLVLGPGTCGAVSGQNLVNFNNMTCVGSNSGRNLGNGSSLSTFVGPFGNASNPVLVANESVVIQGLGQGMSILNQDTIINSAAGSYTGVGGGGNIFAGPGSGGCAGSVRGVFIGAASASGNNGGAKGCSKMIVLGGNTGNANITGSGAIIVGDGTATTTCTNGLNYILIGTGFESPAVDCPSGSVTNWINISNTIIQATQAPTILSGFGTSPSIVAGASTAGFTLNVGTGGTASSGVVQIPTGSGPAPHGWICNATDTTNPASSSTVSTPTSTTSFTLTNYSRTTGAVTAWAASDVIAVSCNGF